MKRSLASLCVLTLALCAGCGGDDDGDGGGGAGGAADAGVNIDGGGAGGAGGGGMGGAGGGAGGMGGGAGGMGGGMGGMGGGEPDPCESACERFAMCSVEVCDGYEAGQAADAQAICMEACERLDQVPVIIDGSESCEDIVAFGLQVFDNNDYAVACGDAQQQNPECDDFGARIAGCLVPVCAPAADLQPGLTSLYTNICNTLVDEGEVTPEVIGMLVAADPMCQGEALAALVQDQITPDPERPGETGLLEAFCAEGPLQSEMTCEAACELTGFCAEGGVDLGGLGDPELCEVSCRALSNVGEEAWPCVAAAEACEDLGACFTPPNVEACGPFSARLAQCVTAQCETLAPIQDELGVLLVQACNEGVATGIPEADVVAASAPEADCEANPLLAGFTEAVLNGDDEDPEDMGLGPWCERELLLPPETCRGVCEVTTRCIDEVDPTSELTPELCVLLCTIDGEEVPTEAWNCVDGLGEEAMCQQVFACLPQD